MFCTGDLVGYGPDPNSVVSLVKEWFEVRRGNHDFAISRKEEEDIK